MFPKVNGVDRVLLLAADLRCLMVEYQFAKISGGSVLKRTIGSLPDPAPAVVPAPELAVLLRWVLPSTAG